MRRHFRHDAKRGRRRRRYARLALRPSNRFVLLNAGGESKTLAFTTLTDWEDTVLVLEATERQP